MTGPMPILFGGLMAWGLYRRVRRNIGQQKLHPGRSIFSIVVFSLVILVLFGVSLQMPKLMLGIGGGLLLGAPLGWLGLRLTKFETTEAGHFYTPNTHIGIVLSALFAGRMLYRFWPRGDNSLAASQPQLFQSPLTLFIFGLMAGYYIVYHIGLLVHARDKK
jgi:hypothetical protein